MINLQNLKIGDRVFLPLTPEHKLLPGTVVYIHRERRFFTVEFHTESGAYVRESYPFHGPLAMQEKGKAGGEEN